LEELVFGDFVDWIKDVFLKFANYSRELETGKIQEYVWMSAISIAVIAAILLAINFYGPIFGWFDGWFGLFATLIN
jgi:membrane-bound ClpP family serine protease